MCIAATAAACGGKATARGPGGLGSAARRRSLRAQAFSAWIHICAVRLFVESILRYGLPPKFLAVLMKPQQKTAPKLRKLLASLFGSQGAAALHGPNVVHAQMWFMRRVALCRCSSRIAHKCRAQLV